ncbi:MAG: GNAT family N-acetyltransferase [Nocardioides sp.]
MISIRPFEPDDLPQLWSLARLPDSGITADPSAPLPLPVRRVPPSGPADLVDPAGTVLSVGGVLLVAIEDDHVVGVGGLRPVRERPHLGRLIRIRVHPARRRLGLGRQLMESLEASARRLGLTDLLLDVGDHQSEALAFYRSLGWSETWREAGPEWQWQTVWFHRSLERSHLTVEVRPCADVADADAAERGLPTRGKNVHHRRYEKQRSGSATYLLAWEGPDVVGHVLLQATSKYPEVSASLGKHPEVRSLRVADHARRHGVGTALMGAVAGVAQEQGERLIGLALEPDNDAAVTLCRRLGWLRRPGLDPVDEWTWVDATGIEHAEQDACGYWTLTLDGARRGG